MRDSGGYKELEDQRRQYLILDSGFSFKTQQEYNSNRYKSPIDFPVSDDKNNKIVLCEMAKTRMESIYEFFKLSQRKSITAKGQSYFSNFCMSRRFKINSKNNDNGLYPISNICLFLIGGESVAKNILKTIYENLTINPQKIEIEKTENGNLCLIFKKIGISEDQNSIVWNEFLTLDEKVDFSIKPEIGYCPFEISFERNGFIDKSNTRFLTTYHIGHCITEISCLS